MLLALIWTMGAGCDALLGDGDGNGIEPTQACVDYLACLEAAESDTIEIERSAYGPEGSCWADPQTALVCDDGCESGILVQQLLTPEPLECWAAGPPINTATLFMATGTEFEVVSGDGPDGCTLLVGNAVYLTGSATDETFNMTLTFTLGDDELTYMRGECRFEADRTFDCDKAYDKNNVLRGSLDYPDGVTATLLIRTRREGESRCDWVAEPA